MGLLPSGPAVTARHLAFIDSPTPATGTMLNDSRGHRPPAVCWRAGIRAWRYCLFVSGQRVLHWPELSSPKETLHKCLHGQIAALRGARNPHLYRIGSGSCAPCALRFTPLGDLFSVSLTLSLAAITSLVGGRTSDGGRCGPISSLRPACLSGRRHGTEGIHPSELAI